MERRWHRRGRGRSGGRARRSRRNGRALGARRPRGRPALRNPLRRTRGSARDPARSGRPCRPSSHGIVSPPMPIHVRAEPGEYAEACLLPGDPLRAKYIAETYFENAVQRNAERGMLGYTGEFEGRPVSVQSTGMGCPSAAIVVEELVQLGVKRLLRVGTCGGLQSDLALGDLIIALSAIPADATARHLVGTDQHVPTASWELVHGAVHVAKEAGQPMRIGPIVSSDLFYN